MYLDIVAGGSGQGKTEYITDRVIKEAEEKKDRFCYLIVPEQFSLEMQKKMIEKHPRHGYSNIDVLSFHRLAFRIFEDAGYRPEGILEDLGVSMMIRKILMETEEDLVWFRGHMNSRGFVDEIKSAVLELAGYGVSWEDLSEITDSLPDKPVLMNKCKDLSLIYQKLLDKIEGRFLLSEQILQKASACIEDSEITGKACFYFDGFTGFTPVQLTFLSCLLPRADHAVFTVTTPEPLRTGRQDLFHLSEKTVQSLLELCQHKDIKLGNVHIVNEKTPPRFSLAPDLARLERCLFRVRRPEEDREGQVPDNIRLIRCRDPESEAEYVLHKIEELVRKEGYRYRDCAVLSGDASLYAQPFIRQASVLGIPLFEDARRKASYNSGIEGLRALFHLSEMDYSYESVFRYLKSGMSGISEEETDFLENYVLAAGIHGHSMWSKPFSRRLSSYTEDQAEDLDRIRLSFLSETDRICRDLKNKTWTVKEKMTSLYRTMVDLDYPARLAAMADHQAEEGDYVKEKEYRDLFSLILSLMDKIVGIFGDEYIPISELGLLVDAGLETLETGTAPLSMDQVILGDLKRTRLPDIKALFVIGMNDGLIPPAVKDQGIFNEEDRKALSDVGISLSQTRPEQVLEDEFYTYLAFTRPNRSLCFTMSDCDKNGKELRPSRLISALKEIFPLLREGTYPLTERRYYYSREDSRAFLNDNLRRLRKDPDLVTEPDAFGALLGYYLEDDRDSLLAWFDRTLPNRDKKKLSKEFLSDFYGRTIRGSVSRLETFAACPYRYYCIYGLRLREREEFSVHPAELGSMFHRALEKYSRLVREEGCRFADVPKEKKEIWIREAMKAAADEDLSDVFLASARNRYQLESTERIVRRTIGIIETQLANSSFEPDRFELAFGQPDQLDSAQIPLSEGRSMELGGIIDRVDVYEEDGRLYYRIVDYKSGDKQFVPADFYYGQQLQLVLYMNAAGELYQREKGAEAVPAGIFFYHLQDPLLKKDQPDREAYYKMFRMEGLANADPEIIKKLEDPDGKFLSMKVSVNKDGTVKKGAPVMSTEEFQAAGEHAKKKIREIGEQIYQGDIDKSPVLSGKTTACDYCIFREVCGFDTGLGDRCRKLPNLSTDDLKALLRKEGD